MSYDQIYDGFYNGGYCLQTRLAETVWQTKILGEQPVYEGQVLELRVASTPRNSHFPNLKTLHLHKKFVEAADVENLRLVEELHLYCEEISSFELRNLKRLYIHKSSPDKRLRNGLFDKCVNLEEVHFYDVEHVPNMNGLALSNVRKMVFQRCGGNVDFFEALNFFHSLQSLTINECKIEKCGRLGHEHLEYLDLSDNRIRSFDENAIYECRKLKQLILRENIIEEVSLSETSGHRFEFIDLSRNLLKRVPLIPNVERLDVSFNELICFELPNESSIKEIIFDNNSILAKPNVVCTTSLKTLSMKVNAICVDTISDLLPDESVEMTTYKLENLDILRAVFKRNCEPNCTGEIFELREGSKEIASALDTKYGLQKVAGTVRKSRFELLSYGDEEKMYDDSYKFACSSCNRHVELLNRKQPVFDDHVIDKFAKLEDIRITNVRFSNTVFPKMLLSHLKQLFLSDCLKISEPLVLDSTSLPSLKILCLQNNVIKSVGRLELNEVEEISLENNAIETVNEISCKKLRRLNLASNNLKSLVTTMQCLEELEEINLDFNDIESVGEDTFVGCSKLKVVSLRKNRTTIEFKATHRW